MNTLADQLPSLVQTPELLPALFDYVATFIWALSGALIAARRGYVGIGVFIIAVVSATGGGLLRDGLLLNADTAAVLSNPAYILIAIAASLLVTAFGSYVDRWKYLAASVHFVDALGAGTYAVVGVNRALVADLPLIGIVTVGVINAIGGGLLRDVLMRRVPDLFKPGLPFAAASVLASFLFAILVTQTDIRMEGAAFVTIATVSLLNFVMLRYHIRSKPLEAFRRYWHEDDGPGPDPRHH